MNKEKRNIQPHANKEVKHLMVLLDKSQASEFKKMVPELQDTWMKKQIQSTPREHKQHNKQTKHKSTGDAKRS